MKRPKTFGQYHKLCTNYRAAVVMVNRSACSRSIQMIRVWIPLTPKVSPVIFVFEKNENKQKEVMGGDSCSEGRGFEFQHCMNIFDI